MSIIVGELDEGRVFYSSGEGKTLTIHPDEPMADHVTIAFQDDSDESRSAMVIPTEHFRGLLASYFLLMETKEPLHAP